MGPVIREVGVVLVTADEDTRRVGGTGHQARPVGGVCSLDQVDLEVSCFPFYTDDFSIGQDLYIGMPADLDQFG